MLEAITNLKFLISLLILFLILHVILIGIDLFTWIFNLKEEKKNKENLNHDKQNNNDERI